MRELTQSEQDQQELLRLLLAGEGSPPGIPADEKYFYELRQRILRRETK